MLEINYVYTLSMFTVYCWTIKRDIYHKFTFDRHTLFKSIPTGNPYIIRFLLIKIPVTSFAFVPAVAGQRKFKEVYGVYIVLNERENKIYIIIYCQKTPKKLKCLQKTSNTLLQLLQNVNNQGLTNTISLALSHFITSLTV